MRAFRYLRAWLAFQIAIRWMPDRWVYGDGVMHRVWFWLLPWAGDWVWVEEARRTGIDPWGPSRDA